MTDPKNLSSIDCVNILVNQTLLKSLSDQCKLYESLLKTAREEMQEKTNSSPFMCTASDYDDEEED